MLTCMPSGDMSAHTGSLALSNGVACSGTTVVGQKHVACWQMSKSLLLSPAVWYGH